MLSQNRISFHRNSAKPHIKSTDKSIMLSRNDLLLEQSPRQNHSAHAIAEEQSGKIISSNPSEMIMIPAMHPSHHGPFEPTTSHAWGPWDCPLGRCNQIRSHIGNIRYRCLIEMHRPQYLKAPRKSDKSRIAMQVFDIIQNHNGRFLDQSPETGEWVEIAAEKALAKVSQALRKGTKPLLMSEREQVGDVVRDHCPRSRHNSPSQQQQDLPLQQLPTRTSVDPGSSFHGTTGGPLQHPAGTQHGGLSFLSQATFSALSPSTATSGTSVNTVHFPNKGQAFSQSLFRPQQESQQQLLFASPNLSRHRQEQHQRQLSHQQQPHHLSTTEPAAPSSGATQPSSVVLDSIQAELSQISGFLDTLEASSNASLPAKPPAGKNDEEPAGSVPI